jgi:hypothetical protein
MAGDENTRWETYDWALDLEPLALPPDLPPVMVMVLWLGVELGSC